MACMKKPHAAILLVLVAAALLGILYVMFTGPASPGSLQTPGDLQTASVTPAPLRTVTTAVTSERTHPATPAPATQAAPLPTATAAPTRTPEPVGFTLDPGTPVSCGLTCRETAATITNTGDATAHAVCVVLEVFNDNGERISINSAPSIERCLGDIEGKSSRSETIAINADCGFLGGKCVGHTLILKTRARSLEKTQEFPDSLMPV